MLAAAMRRNRFLFRHEMIAESPRNRSCTAASRLALAIPQLAYERRMSAVARRRGLGVSKRNEYGPVVCVPPVACRAGVVFGGNATARASLWCARFMNMVLQHSGFRGTGSDLARSFASYGQRVSGPQIGAIAVMGRRGGGHVGVVSGIDAGGNPIVVSGNNGNRVRETPVSRGRIYAYVMPTN